MGPREDRLHFLTAGDWRGQWPANNANFALKKYRGAVDLKPFKCETIYQSSVVKRLCYDAEEGYVVVNLNGTYHHYCEVPAYVVSGWRASNSMGDFFNKNVKGHFDCRVNRVPAYAGERPRGEAKR